MERDAEHGPCPCLRIISLCRRRGPPSTMICVERRVDGVSSRDASAGTPRTGSLKDQRTPHSYGIVLSPTLIIFVPPCTNVCCNNRGSNEASSVSSTFSINTHRPNLTAFSKVRR